MSAFNAAFSYNIQNSITGAFPAYAIDYPNVLLSRGTLTNVTNVTVSASEPGVINFGWTNNSGDGNALTTDRVMFVVYNPVKDKAVISQAAAVRLEESAAVLIPSEFSGDEVHTWIACLSEDGQLVSSSNYAGAVTVA